jgi:hypothetical protein
MVKDERDKPEQPKPSVQPVVTPVDPPPLPKPSIPPEKLEQEKDPKINA